MNDFTKDELEILLHHDNMTAELYTKIQSLINNYCEPDYTAALEIKMCGKCEEYYK
jgi:hypothetical protein